MPFDASAIALPVLPPLHKTLVVVGMANVKTVGCEIVADVDVVHPFASVAVTVYVPAVRLLIDAVVEPLLHE